MRHKFLTLLKKNKIIDINYNKDNKLKYDYILIDCFSLFYNSKNTIRLLNTFKKKYNNLN